MPSPVKADGRLWYLGVVREPHGVVVYTSEPRGTPGIAQVVLTLGPEEFHGKAEYLSIVVPWHIESVLREAR